MDAALKFGPSAIWLFAATDVSGELNRLGVAAAGRQTAIHLVTTDAGSKEPHLREWFAQHRGTFTLLGRRPAVALNDPSEQ
jgi:hypothetical protein